MLASFLGPKEIYNEMFAESIHKLIGPWEIWMKF